MQCNMKLIILTRNNVTQFKRHVLVKRNFSSYSNFPNPGVIRKVLAFLSRVQLA